MGNNTWDNLLDPHPIARGGSVSNGVSTIQDISPALSPFTAAGELKLGSKIVVEAVGEATSSAATIPTLTLSVWLGSTSTVWSSAAVSLSASQTSNPWHLRWNGIVTAIGASGVATIYGHGILDIALAAVGTYNTVSAIPQTAAARQIATGIDTTVLNKWGVAATFSNTTAGNSVRCDLLNVQILNQGKT